MGVKDSITFNKLCTCLNIFIIVFIIICGAFKIDFKNWSIDSKNVII